MIVSGFPIDMNRFCADDMCNNTIGHIMYVHVQKIKRSNGQVDEYVRILESYRDKGRVKQKLVANLGNKRMLQSQSLSLIKILNPSLFQDAK